jgi:hypothetical protein
MQRPSILRTENLHVLMQEGLADDLLLAAASGNLPTSALMKGEDPISQVGLANFSFTFTVALLFLAYTHSSLRHLGI